MKFLNIFVILFSSLFVHAQTPTKEVILNDFKITIQEVSQIFDTYYALTDYKVKRFQWNKAAIVQDLILRAEADPNLTVLKAQKLINEFFSSARDYHAQPVFSKQPYISIPLGFYSVQGRVYVTFVDPSYTGSIKVGDELIIYDGNSANEALAQLTTQKYPNLVGTDLRDATRRLTERYVLLMDDIPSTPQITMTLKHEDGTQFSETLDWSGYPTAPTTSQVLQKPLSPIPEDLLGYMATDPFGYSSRKSYFPRPDAVIWEAPDTDYFYAWIGEIKSSDSAKVKRIGLIRIPTFSLGSSAESGKAVQAFKVLVDKMNQETDFLVLDLQGNRGGMFDYAEALISFFINSPKEAYKFQYRLSPRLLKSSTETLAKLNQLKNQSDVETFFGGNHYFGYPVDMSFVNDMKAMYQGLLDDSKVGTLAQPRYYNAANIKPYPNSTLYLKPLFVAVDAWSMSCGDFFPAFMQDHKIGTIIGSQTAGAGAFTGGSVATTMNTMSLGKVMSPVALAYRLDGYPLENIGVTPDYPIVPEPSDLQDGKYQVYQKRMFELLDNLTD